MSAQALLGRRNLLRGLGLPSTYRLRISVGGWWRSPRRLAGLENPLSALDPPEIMA
jgi:hypothetical protein